MNERCGGVGPSEREGEREGGREGGREGKGKRGGGGITGKARRGGEEGGGMGTISALEDSAGPFAV
jgi:hypothetical protein